MNDERGGPVPPGEPVDRGHSGDWRPIGDGTLALIVAAFAATLVLGYLFVNKMADISTEEDCALAHRNNCAPIELNR